MSSSLFHEIKAGRQKAHLKPVRRGTIADGIGEGLRDFLNFAVANTGCADAHPASGAIHQRAYRL
jgi:hypothetical protein